MEVSDVPIKTGDVLLFSNNSPTGILMRAMTSTDWNHGGIAVRLIRDINGKVTVTTDETGQLTVFEINTSPRYDVFTGETLKGVGFSDYDWVKNGYNMVAVRRLRDKYRRKEIKRKIAEFYEDHKDVVFPKDLWPFIGVWWGIPVTGTEVRYTQNGDQGRRNMFCTELMTYFYHYCFGPIIEAEERDSKSYRYDTAALFGLKGSSLSNLMGPKHYSYNETPNAILFSGKDEIVYLKPASPTAVLGQIAIITIFVLVIIWMTLPKKEGNPSR